MTRIEALGQTATEAVYRIHFVSIVLFQDAANLHYGAHVLVRLTIWVHVVQGICLSWRTIGGSEINRYLEADLTAAKDVI